MTTVLDAALDYASRGWHVFPVRGKLPATELVPRWSKGSTTDPDIIAGWYDTNPDLGIGLDLAKSRLAVVDGDHLDKMTLPEELLTGWPYRGNPDRKSWLFQLNGTPVPQAVHEWGEVKAAGGYVVLPPSPHAVGGEYVWLGEHDGTPPIMPQELIPLIAKKERTAPTGEGWDGGEITDGQRQQAASILARWSDTVASCPEGGGKYGGRNRTLNNAAYALGHLAPHYIKASVVRDALLDAADICGLEYGEAMATIVSGLRKGMSEPEALPLDVDEEAILGDEEPSPASEEKPRPKKRRVKLTSAAAIDILPVRWLWKDRVPCGEITLLGGREGIGKSANAYEMTARITTGELEGSSYGTPASVLVAATEDSWAHTIVPRLMAAGADLGRVFRVEVETPEGWEGVLSLPADLEDLQEAAEEVGAVMLLLDPLLSRLDSRLDTHKDADVRRALEPLKQWADKTGCAVIGLIHVNKSSSTDPLTTLMASRAFAAVARAVLFVMVDPDDESGRTRLIGTAKSNLGRTDLPVLSFTIDEVKVSADVTAPKIAWNGTTQRTLSEALRASQLDTEERTAADEAADWLKARLTDAGGPVESATLKDEARREGHNVEAMKRARRKLKLVVINTKTAPRRTLWDLPNRPKVDEEAILGDE